TPKLAAGVVPNETPVAPLKLVPEMTTDVPPPAGPLFGPMPVTAGGGVTKVNVSADPVGLVPPRLVTVTLTGPAAPAGDVAVIDLPPLTVKLAAGVAPNETPVAPLKFVPEMVTLAPPAVLPVVGLSPLTTGAGVTKVKASAAPVALVPPGVVTVMSTVPAPPAGAVAVICVALLGVKAAAGAAPNLTAETPVNPVPVMTTDVPPAVVLLAGLIPVTVGAATGGT